MHVSISIPAALVAQIHRSRVALSLSPAGGGFPLTAVNDCFETLTGYDNAEIIGRNCRMLQDPATPPAQIAAMSEFLADESRDDGRFPVLNRKRDGALFTNLVFMSKLRDVSGKPRFVIASQFDVTASNGARALSENDRVLEGSIGDMRRLADQVGLAMADSAELLARSVATLARMAVRDA